MIFRTFQYSAQRKQGKWTHQGNSGNLESLPKHKKIWETLYAQVVSSLILIKVKNIAIFVAKYYDFFSFYIQCSYQVSLTYETVVNH